MELIFFSWIRISDLEHRLHAVGIGNNRARDSRDRTACLDDLELGVEALRLFRRMITPSLPPSPWPRR